MCIRFVSMTPDTIAVVMQVTGRENLCTVRSTGAGGTRAIIPVWHKKNAGTAPDAGPQLMAGHPCLTVPWSDPSPAGQKDPVWSPLRSARRSARARPRAATGGGRPSPVCDVRQRAPGPHARHRGVAPIRSSVSAGITAGHPSC